MDLKLIFWVLCVIVFLLKTDAVWMPECSGLKNHLPAMFKCCNIFGLGFMSDKREYCAMECLDGDNDDECCFEKCFGEMSGIYKDNALNHTALKFSITKRSHVGDDGVFVTEKSLLECMKRFKFLKKLGACQIPLHVLEVTKCVLIENFVNCPNMDPECNKYKNFIKPCQPVTTRGPQTAKIATTMPPRTVAAVTRPPGSAINRNFTGTSTRRTDRKAPISGATINV